MKVAISGASRGIERRTSEKLVEKGYEVWEIARSKNLLLEVSKRGFQSRR